MAGTVNLSAPSYLPSLYGAGSGGDSLLASLYGYGSRQSSAGTVNPIAALTQAKAGEAKQVALTARDPAVRRDITQFTQALTRARTPGDLLSDPVALKVLLTANGLGDQVAHTALAKQALLSDPAKADALVNKLRDTRWKSVNQTFGFATKGLSVLRTPAATAAVTQGYAEVVWRRSLNQTTPGLANALDFTKRASTISTVDQVLSDPTFREVITMALGVPKQIAFQNLPAQETAITSRIDLTKFKDPKFVDHFTQRYLIAAADAAQSAGSSGGGDLTNLAVRSGGLIV